MPKLARLLLFYTFKSTQKCCFLNHDLKIEEMFVQLVTGTQFPGKQFASERFSDPSIIVELSFYKFLNSQEIYVKLLTFVWLVL